MKIVNILLLEDDPLDIIDIKRNFSKTNINYSLHVASNGEEALTYLKERTYSYNLPNVVILDLNMPRMNGFEFLKVLRYSREFQHIQCFILSSSDEPNDRHTAKKLGVSGYLVKPLKFNGSNSIDAFNLLMDLKNA